MAGEVDRQDAGAGASADFSSNTEPGAEASADSSPDPGTEAAALRVQPGEHLMDDDTKQAMSDEQAADLRRLEMSAGEPDLEQQQAAQLEEQQAAQEVAAAADQNTKSVALMLALAVPFLGKLYPCIIDIYTDEAQAAMAGTLGPVFTKHHINLGDLGGDYKEEIAAVMVCGPIAWATYAGIKADIATRAQQVPKAVASTAQQAPKIAEPVVLG